jgi:hypothetical protein
MQYIEIVVEQTTMDKARRSSCAAAEGRQCAQPGDEDRPKRRGRVRQGGWSPSGGCPGGGCPGGGCPGGRSPGGRSPGGRSPGGRRPGTDGQRKGLIAVHLTTTRHVGLHDGHVQRDGIATYDGEKARQEILFGPIDVTDPTGFFRARFCHTRIRTCLEYAQARYAQQRSAKRRTGSLDGNLVALTHLQQRITTDDLAVDE